jgi:geranylgeranylglycerol-phosphate geranylgeranyltransferase
VLFVWALTVAYLIASGLHPRFALVLLVPSGYLLCLGIYILNDIMDLGEDKINSESRPIAAGVVKKREAWGAVIVSVALALIGSFFVNLPTFGLFAIAFFLGLAYSWPRIHAKKRFPFKLIVAASGAAIASLTGGIAAENLNAIIFFAGVAFALFALVTLLLGDIADMRGDYALRVKSFPIIFGARRAVIVVATLPIILSVLGIAVYRYTNLNLIFPLLLVGVSCYSSFSIAGLWKNYNDPKICRNVKSKMRVMHLVIQLAFIIGLIPL